MDVAYDQIQEEALSPQEENGPQNNEGERRPSLNSEFQEAFKAVSSSPWGARLGGFFGQVRKQGESLYSDAQKVAQREYSNASTQASKGLSDLQSSIIERTRGISFSQTDSNAVNFSDPTFTLPERSDSTDKKASEASESAIIEENAERPESLPADIVKEASSMVSRFRSEAARRLVEIQKAEDAADEALLKFGTNVRNFLRDAVTVTAPDAAAAAGLPVPPASGQTTEVLFETSDAEGKRVFHSSRLDARLHVIHSREESFLSDPESPEWASWEKSFDIEKETDTIAKDLDKHEDLRRQMGRLVPERVEYAAFWRRYYFLRKAVEEEENKRKEMLKGAAASTEEDIGWGDDDEEEDSTTPLGNNAAASGSTTTLTAPPVKGTLKPASPRRSNEEDGKSVADSDASYDIVSGATSRAPGSPKEDKKHEEVLKEESDEEDWE